MDKTVEEIHHHKEKTHKSIHGYISSIQIEIKKSKGIVYAVNIYRYLLQVIPAAATI